MKKSLNIAVAIASALALGAATTVPCLTGHCSAYAETSNTAITSTRDSDGVYHTSDGKKVLSTFITLEKETYEYIIHIKQTVEWTVTPKDRYTDILGINFADHIRVAGKDGYPDVSLCVNFNENEYDGNKYVGSSAKTTVYTGKDRNYYACGFDHVAFIYSLPRAEYSESGHTIKTDNITVTMETTFRTNFWNLTGTSIQSIFIHQNGSGKFDFNNLYFAARPTVIYRNRVWVNDPEFDTALGSDINVTFDVGSSPQNRL